MLARPGNSVGVGAAARDFGQKVHQRRHHRHAGEFNRPLQHRQIGVEPFARQQRAARRAGHAHDTVDADVLGAHGGGQIGEFLALLGVFVAGEEGQVVGADPGLAGHARQHLGHQAATRMGGQVQPRVLRQRLDERERVGHRAGADGGVVERVDAVAVMRKEFGHPLRVQRPEFAEGAVGVDEGAVDQHQQRLAFGLRGRRHLGELESAALERGQRLPLQRVDAGVNLAVDLGHHLAGDKVHRLVLDEAGDDLEGRQQHVAQKAAAARGRGLLQSAPAQLRRHRHFIG